MTQLHHQVAGAAVHNDVVPQGVTDGHVTVHSHRSQQGKLCGSQARYRKSWVTHAARDVPAIPGSSSPQSITGTTMVVTRISKAEREMTKGKKYMGDCSRLSRQTITMMTVLPINVTE